MDKSRLRARYWRILAFFARATLHFIFFEIILFRIGFRGYVRRTRTERFRRIAARFRALAIRLGGVLIKLGQFLSSRLDVLPVEITDELAGLQDEVPAEKFEDIRAIAEAELGAPLAEKYDWFELEPMAAASLGQVHRARLKQDAPDAAEFREVVVKVQRPFIDQIIEVDFAAVKRFGTWLEKYEPVRKRVDVMALIAEVTDTIRREVDYAAEAQNAETFAGNFKENRRVHVPRVVHELCAKRVLTLENVFAIKITDYDAITAAGIDRGEVASALLDTYLQQIFEDGFFHADPHPGNLFVTPLPAVDGKVDWRLTFVDFGMVGNVPEDLRAGLREMLVAVGMRDAGRLVRAYQKMDMLLPTADLALIEKAEAMAFDRFWGMSMNELRNISHAEMMKFAMQFRELMYEMPFQMPQNLIMLGRTIAILSGMCTGLEPEFNVWGEVAPYAQKLVADEAKDNWRVWLDEALEMLKALVALPSQAARTLTLAERGDLKVQAPQVSRQLERIDSSVNRAAAGLFFVGLMVAGSIVYTGGDRVLAYGFFGGSFVVLFWTLFLIRPPKA
jgi:predicted unusual protein kinase regulating ubiquinone biosynthesis (AarF/ABC1/UbiB family)